MTRLIRICGNIASGKTTLARLLEQHLGWQAVLEDLNDMVFFNDFYSDMSRWGFHQQVSFLLADLRYQQIKLDAIMASAHQPVVMDWLYEVHYQVYFKAFVENGFATEKEETIYQELSERIGVYISKPQYVIFVDAPPRVLLERVRARQRDAEKNISIEYLECLNRRLSEMVSGLSQYPILEVNSHEIDFVGSNHSIAKVVDLVHAFIEDNSSLIANGGS